MGRAWSKEKPIAKSRPLQKLELMVGTVSPGTFTQKQIIEKRMDLLRRRFEDGDLVALYDVLVECSGNSELGEGFFDTPGAKPLPEWASLNLLPVVENWIRGPQGKRGRASYGNQYKQRIDDARRYYEVKYLRDRGMTFTNSFISVGKTEKPTVGDEAIRSSYQRHVRKTKKGQEYRSLYFPSK